MLIAETHIFPEQVQRMYELAGMVALLVGGAPFTQIAEAAQDYYSERVRTRAEAGDADAQNSLGLIYSFGLSGLPTDHVKAYAMILITGRGRLGRNSSSVS